MADNVFRISADVPAPLGVVDPEVVELAERILEMAASGQISSLAYVSVHASQGTGTGWAGMECSHLCAGASMLQKRLNDFIWDDD